MFNEKAGVAFATFLKKKSPQQISGLNKLIKREYNDGETPEQALEHLLKAVELEMDIKLYFAKESGQA